MADVGASVVKIQTPFSSFCATPHDVAALRASGGDDEDAHLSRQRRVSFYRTASEPARIVGEQEQTEADALRCAAAHEQRTRNRVFEPIFGGHLLGL